MATKNIVPRAAHEGQLGTAAKPWLKVIADEVDIGAVSVQTQLDDKEPLHRFSRMVIAESECLDITFADLNCGGIVTGAIFPGAATAAHPGVMTYVTSASANSGYRITSYSGAAMLLAGGESFSCVFYVDATTETTVRMGYHDTATITAPVDGVYLRIVGTTLTGVAMSNGSETDTADAITITQGVWYRAGLVLNADASLATFTLFTCADGQPVAWVRNTVASNIPTGAGRYCGTNICATNANSGAQNSKAIFSLDWFSYWIDRVLVR